uniref:Uncharacterized protein n=1 Tax=Nelumbo nucifera TaxID=4432 RepID=A0A822ZJZ7_NELNU|nr:TPA_asm: hypothetical protein HUJ06_003080 [Nelumbo nucifera]
MANGIPYPLRMVASAAAIFFGGVFTMSLASSVTIRALQATSEAKRGATLSKLSWKGLLLI